MLVNCKTRNFRFNQIYQKPGMLCYNPCNLIKQVLGVNRSCWVRWRTKNQQSWLLSEFGLKNLWIQEKIFRNACWKNHRCCISDPGHFRVTNPKWCRNYNLKKESGMLIGKCDPISTSKIHFIWMTSSSKPCKGANLIL